LQQSPSIPSLFLNSTVCRLCAQTCDDDQKQYVVMAVHPRVATGRVNTPELPTGFLEDSGDFAGKVAEAIEQDIGLRLSDKDMTDLTQMSIGQHWPGVYGIGHESDETIRIFLYRSRWDLCLHRCRPPRTANQSPALPLHVQLAAAAAAGDDDGGASFVYIAVSLTWIL
jgi:hypothetical protein